MKHEVPVINLDGTVVERHRHLVEQLHKEAALGRVDVNLYRGTEVFGSEAFYTLSDGTVLHEVNGTAEDGSDYRMITLIVDGPEPDLLQRLLSRVHRRSFPTTKT